MTGGHFCILVQIVRVLSVFSSPNLEYKDLTEKVQDAAEWR